MAKTVTSNEIREYVRTTYIQPARQRGDKVIAFTASDIHTGMALKSRFPIVCSSINADKFLEYASVTLIKREGPKQSSTVRWVLRYTNKYTIKNSKE